MKQFNINELETKNHISKKRTSQRVNVSTEASLNEELSSRRIYSILSTFISDFNEYQHDGDIRHHEKRLQEQRVIEKHSKLRKMKKIKLAKKLQKKIELEKAYILNSQVVEDVKKHEISICIEGQDHV